MQYQNTTVNSRYSMNKSCVIDPSTTVLAIIPSIDSKPSAEKHRPRMKTPFMTARVPLRDRPQARTGSYHLHHVAPTLAVEHLDQLPWMKWKYFFSFTALISFLCLSATSFIHGSSFISFTALISFLHSNAISFFHAIYFICVDFHFILLWPLFHSLMEFISFFHGT